MSRNESSTKNGAPATVAPLNGRPYAAADVFQDLAADFKAGADVWREVTPQFARYVLEVLPPIEGPDGSGSYALGEMFDRLHGAIHCVVAHEEQRFFAKYVDLMLWGVELLSLRDALAEESGT